MENFKDFKVQSLNGVLYIQGDLMERSLVLANPDKKVCYNVMAKCRNTDMHSIVKCLVKAQLATKREQFLENTKKDTARSNHTVTDASSRPMSSMTCIYVTDKNGHIIENSLVTCRDAKNLKGAFGIKNNDTLTKLVVEEGKAWDNPEVIDEMNCLVRTIIGQLDYGQRVDKAVEAAANSTEKEQKAAEKAEKEAAKAKAEAEKEVKTA